MSYAAPFSLLSFRLPDRDDSMEERLTWPLAGSLAIHVVVFIAFLSLRFASSLGQAAGSYEVTLVTLPEIAASPAASPANKSRSKRNADKVPRPKAKAGKAPKAAPQRKAMSPPIKAVSPPIPVPQEKPRVPERVTESLVGALDSVVVPKPQTLALSPTAAPVPASAPPSVKHSPAVKIDGRPIQAPPQPPKLVIGKSETLPPAPNVAPLAQTLKQAVDSIVVPKKPKPASRRVNPAAMSDVEQIQDTTMTPESPRMTLPSRAPRLATVAPPETLEKTPQPPKRAVPLVSETSPPPKAAEARDLPQKTFMPPQAPQLAQLPVEPDPVPSQLTVPMTTSEPDTLGNQIAKLTIPSDFDAHPVSKQTKSGMEEMLGLRAGSCSNADWEEKVEKKIRKIHEKYWKNYLYIHRVKSPAILTFRVERNGQVVNLAVFRSSGNEKFDLAAQRAVLAAVPLPSFPANMTKPFCQVHHEFKVKPNQ